MERRILKINNKTKSSFSPFIKKKLNEGKRKIMENEDRRKEIQLAKKKFWEKGGDQKRTTLEVFFFLV